MSFNFSSKLHRLIAGGGGVLLLPAYLLTGMPAQYASGCNKFSASSGTIIATIKYFRSKKMDFAAVAFSVLFALNSYDDAPMYDLGHISSNVIRPFLYVVLSTIFAKLFFDIFN